MEVNEITERVIGCLYQVSNTLGCGFLEKVYENASAIAIAKAGLRVQQQFPIKVRYEGIIVGEFFADLLVEELVLVEMKAVKLLEDVHTAQCLNYLRATGLPVCLLVNFYRPKVEIKRIIPHDSWKTNHR
ncbi:MAG: GxxExxY protein [Chloroflexi bacterium]|nr:GxxExxY protein [Chloroflexota bacterium]